jgi:16S rRNA processing protein RimM
MQLVVGRIGRAHGVRGDLFVEPFTDEPDKRFASGAQLETSDNQFVTVHDTKWHSGKLVVHFVGVNDRTAAEGLRGLELTADVDPQELPEEEGEYYDRQLVGMDVVMDGAVIGIINDVIHLPAQDLIEFSMQDDRRILIPFVNEFVPDVDVASNTMTITPPNGLINEEQAIEVRGEDDEV